MTTTLGFVGLGAMGGRMARRLLDAGYTVCGYNRTAAKAADLVRAGMTLAASPRDVAERAGAVFTMVTDDAALEAVTQPPDGLLAGWRRDTILIEMSTVSPAVIERLAGAVAARGGALLDAPVSGSPATLDAGQLSFMVGGDRAVLERVRPYLEAVGPTITHVGAVGLAKSMKIAVNQGLAVQMLAFSEAVLLAEKAGIDRARAVEVLLKSVVASPMVKYRGPFVLGMPEQAWFDVDMIQKDLRLALDMARASGVTLPSVALTHEFMTAAKGLGLAHYDFAVVFDVIARMSNLPPSRKL
ncbi:MAG TPA: NAD(P)-dependent oxidoreductase [Candidatus Limnocylindria bacterium]|nr:NAD(P)-dependent oxidoreductase [Candidatus Limnocylindria bacterium]